MARGFTAIAIKHLMPGDKRREIPDPGARGLYAIVEPSGFKSFAVRFRFGRQDTQVEPRQHYCRQPARRLPMPCIKSSDPTAAKKAAKAERKAIEADTFAAIAERYFTIECGLRRVGENLTFNGKLRSADRRYADVQCPLYPPKADISSVWNLKAAST